MKEIQLTSQQQAVIQMPNVFLCGQAGTGKTTVAVKRMLSLIQDGVHAESILILIPQRSLAQPFRDVINTPGFQAGGEPSILTIGGLAQRMLTLFWPMFAKNAGFFSASQPPRYLTLETAQYYMARLVEPLLQKGYFESVTIDPNRLYSQILDNLNKSAVVGFTPTEIASRLIQAWPGKPSQAVIYEQAQECAMLFREFCFQQNLLDFSMQLSEFMDQLWQSFFCRQYLKTNYHHLIYDNAEEDYPIAHDVVESWLPEFETSMIITDSNGGFRTFMGADPTSAARFSTLCGQNVEFNNSFVKTVELDHLESVLRTSLQEHCLDVKINPNIQNSFSINSFRFHPQMVDWLVTQVNELITEKKIPPEQIVILTPFLSDALRFSVTTRFTEAGIPLSTFRPSRSLQDEPAVRAVVTLVKLAHPSWGIKPTKDEVRNAFMLIIADCDYIRADLLSQTLYSVAKGSLNIFKNITNNEMRQRLTYSIGERFDKLRDWLEENKESGSLELDIFISRLFGELLSQTGYKFHGDFDASAAVNRMVESARKFRQIMTEDPQQTEKSVSQEYIHLIEAGILSAQYLSDWRSPTQSRSVLISPAFSYLMSDHPVQIQFWLDIGSQGWWARLDQPLTHPYVLNRNWEAGCIWTDALEHNTNQQALERLTSGLIRRCSGHIFMCSLGINEQGSEERGALIMAVQTLLRKLKSGIEGMNV